MVSRAGAGELWLVAPTRRGRISMRRRTPWGVTTRVGQDVPVRITSCCVARVIAT